MNDFQKARLKLLGLVVLFFIFTTSAVFGIVKVINTLKSEPAAQKNEKTPLPEPQFKTQTPAIKEVKPEKKTEPQKIILDDSKAFRGIRREWKKYRLPKCGILADVTNNRILWSYNADRVVPIASLSKMLTIYMALDIIKKSKGRITLQNRVKISKTSATGREGGFGFMPGDIYTVEDLMQAAAIRSANDAAAALAFYFGNGESNFVKMMNLEVKKLDMKNSSFINPHGLPVKSKDNLSTMNDMLLLSLKMINEPDYMRWVKKKAVKIGEKTIVNTNNLMRKRKYPGVDGLKTGYTRRAGFCLAFSCLRNGRRLVGVVAGFPSAADRENFVTALLNWAYR